MGTLCLFLNVLFALTGRATRAPLGWRALTADPTSW